MSTSKIIRHKPGALYCDAVSWQGQQVCLAGKVARNLAAGMREQTADVLAQIDELLAAAGTDKSRLLSATVYIADLALKPEMDAAWSRWIDPANPPTRATVEAKFAPRGALVEIVCSAAQ